MTPVIIMVFLRQLVRFSLNRRQLAERGGWIHCCVAIATSLPPTTCFLSLASAPGLVPGRCQKCEMLSFIISNFLVTKLIVGGISARPPSCLVLVGRNLLNASRYACAE